MCPVRPEYHPVEKIPADGVLAAVFFGGAAHGDFLTVDVAIPQTGPRAAEVWRVDGDIRREQRNGVALAISEDVLFGTIRSQAGPSDEITAAAYDAVVDAARAAGYPNLWRIWNHIGGINEDEDGLERYKRFSAGRHEALTRHGYARDRFPAASAVGMNEPGLLVYFVAGRREGVQVENPRQVSAYDYPPQYGPRSPSFSRATVIPERLIFVSGTASVVGHESRHGGSAAAQLAETVDNLDATLSVAASVVGRRATVRDLSVAKIYLRGGAGDAALISRLREVFPSSILLAADICRRELLLEIEGVALL